MPEELTKILYVEDEADIQEVAKIALETVGGFTLKVCSSAEEALSQAESFEPQLFLLDVMMPGMDGPETLVELRKISSIADVPVIFMTAKVQPDEIDRFKQMGALEVIAKPFDPMSLAEKIRTCWSESST